MTSRVWILGAADPEMAAIERLLRECGETIGYAQYRDERVRPADAYRATRCRVLEHPGDAQVYLVECGADPASQIALTWADAVVIDHHRPGDPGFGHQPAEFLAASSIGQVCQRIGYQPGRDTVLTAAADHCLEAAYRGECPGVDPAELLEWRIAQQAAFRGVDPQSIRAGIEATRAALHAAPTVVLESGHLTDWVLDADGHEIPVAAGAIVARDMRRAEPWPELPEAATSLGVAYVSGPLIDPRDPEQRRKYTVSGTPDVVRAWMEHWAPAQGIEGIYGDPARGFGGGYLKRA